MAILSNWNGFVSLVKDSTLPVSFHFNYIKGTSHFDRLKTLNFVIAVFSAKIDQSHLGPWAQLDTLDQTRVKIVDSTVELKGPVLIVGTTPYHTFIKKITVLGSALIGGTGVTLISYAVRAIIRSNQQLNKGSSTSFLPSLALGIIAGIGSGIMASNLLENVMSKTQGIFFLNFPSFTK